MAGMYDCASSNLLCAEDQRSILGFDDDEEEEGGGHGKEESHHVDVVGSRPLDCEMGGVFWDGFMDLPPFQAEECLAILASVESDHLPKGDYAQRLMDGALELSMRREAIDWIGKVHAHYNFGPLSAYLCVNYLDRFLSSYDLPQGKVWMAQLLSVACLSLAAKMEETLVPPSLDLQICEAKYVFEAKTIQRMELLVLSTLNWKMRAVTPFSFLDYFLHKFNGDTSLMRKLFSRSVDLILNTIRRIDLLEFRPSEVAAAVALSVSGKMHPLAASKALSSCLHIDKERALRCYEVIRGMALISRPFKSASGSISSMPQSPIGVLDAACISFKSDDTTTIETQASSPRTYHDKKRRKIDRLSTTSKI